MRFLSFLPARSPRPVLALSLLAVALGVTACSSTINVSALEGEVASQVAVQQEVPASEVSVDCPDAIEVAEGSVTTCAATVAGASSEIEVTQIDGDGRVEWVIVEPGGEPAP